MPPHTFSSIRRHPSRNPSRDGAASPPPTAARLAAEAAFSALPEDRVAADPPAVTVVRKRLLSALPTEPAAIPVDGEVARAPRVFSVAQGQTTGAALGLARPEGLGDEAPAPTDTADIGVGRRRHDAAKAERVGHDRRAGVIRHVQVSEPRWVPPGNRAGRIAAVSALPGAGDGGPAAGRFAVMPAPFKRGGAEDLRQQLAQLELTFASIRSAQDFRVTDDRISSEWQRLSQVAEDIARGLGR